MRFKLYREYGALNSKPVFAAFEKGISSLGHTVVTDNEDVAVIWSVLWSGRMLSNQKIYNDCKLSNKPIIIIEIGNLYRGVTWRIGLNHINRLGIFGNDSDLDATRPSLLNVMLQPQRLTTNPQILIATQHRDSLQWENMPSMEQWVIDTYKQIRKYSDRPVIVRPHPRSRIVVNIPEITIEQPKLLSGTYDSFDINYNYHRVINHNSGPAVQASINGSTVICDTSSLAWPVSSTFEDIEKNVHIDREEWFLKLCHTEWTVSEIAQGIPLQRLEKFLVK